MCVVEGDLSRPTPTKYPVPIRQKTGGRCHPNSERMTPIPSHHRVVFIYLPALGACMTKTSGEHIETAPLELSSKVKHIVYLYKRYICA